MTPAQALILFLAAAAGGAINSVAGGGSFLSFPALLVYGQIPSIQANATSTVALWPGSVASAAAYRRELNAQRRTLLELGSVSLIGGVLGALTLVHTRSSTFERMLPWLLLAATLMFAFGGAATKRIRARAAKVRAPGWAGVAAAMTFQLLIAFYGGFFGGGIGILMLASLALMGMEDIHAMNALKTILGSLINGVAVVLFIAYGKVVWAEALLMIVGAVLGGYFGAFYARKLEPAYVRRFVIAVGCAMTVWFFFRYG